MIDIFHLYIIDYVKEAMKASANFIGLERNSEGFSAIGSGVSTSKPA
jgi:hypothetical protein